MGSYLYFVIHTTTYLSFGYFTMPDIYNTNLYGTGNFGDQYFVSFDVEPSYNRPVLRSTNSNYMYIFNLFEGVGVGNF